jgi:hypothetical protein
MISSLNIRLFINHLISIISFQMSNPFEALNISDDEDEQQFTTTGAEKIRKSISLFYH